MFIEKELLNDVLGDMEDIHHKSGRGVATVYKEPRLKSFPSNNNREQDVTRGNSSHPVCGILL